MSEQQKVWYVAIAGQQSGPFTVEEVLGQIRSGAVRPDAHVFTGGMENWISVTEHPSFAEALTGGSTAGAAAALPATAAAPITTSNVADVIDYVIIGQEMQYVEITLDPGEACVAEAGAFMYMDPAIEVETIFGDGSAQGSGGLMGALLGAGKRVLTGESLFMTVFGNQGGSRQKVAFASPYPGSIVALDLSDHGGRILCQKDSFLCAAKGVSVGIALQRRLGAGLFGGEGFILQRLDGDGLVFVHAGGVVTERNLAAGETVRLDTGCLVAFEQTVDYDIETVRGIKTALFGGEGLFYARLTGPGKIWMQSLPFSRLASRVFAALPGKGQRKGEGSVLGGLGDVLMGDN